jgi:hypothetical protein
MLENDRERYPITKIALCLPPLLRFPPRLNFDRIPMIHPGEDHEPQSRIRPSESQFVKASERMPPLGDIVAPVNPNHRASSVNTKDPLWFTGPKTSRSRGRSAHMEVFSSENNRRISPDHEAPIRHWGGPPGPDIRLLFCLRRVET